MFKKGIRYCWLESLLSSWWILLWSFLLYFNIGHRIVPVERTDIVFSTVTVLFHIMAKIASQTKGDVDNNEIETLFEKRERNTKANRQRWEGHVIRSGYNRLINNVFWERQCDVLEKGGKMLPEDIWRNKEIVAHDRQEWKAIANTVKNHEKKKQSV